MRRIKPIYIFHFFSYLNSMTILYKHVFQHLLYHIYIILYHFFWFLNLLTRISSEKNLIIFFQIFILFIWMFDYDKYYKN